MSKRERPTTPTPKATNKSSKNKASPTSPNSKKAKTQRTQEPNIAQNLLAQFNDEASDDEESQNGGKKFIHSLLCGCKSCKGGSKSTRRTRKTKRNKFKKTKKVRKIKAKKSKKTIKKRTLKAKKGVKHAKGGFSGFSFANTPFTTFDYSSRFNDNKRLKIYPEYFLRDIYDIHKNIITPQQTTRGTFNKVPVSFNPNDNTIHNIDHTFNEIMKTLDSTNGNVSYPIIKTGMLGQNKIKCIVDVALNKKDSPQIEYCKKILK